MGVTNYHSVNGQVLGEKASGVPASSRIDYVTNVLGGVVQAGDYFMAIIVFLLVALTITTCGCQGQKKPNPIEAVDFAVLPKEAQIVELRPGDWGGDGDVYIRLPNSRGVDSWMNQLWSMNIGSQEVIMDEKYVRVASDGAGTIVIAYVPGTKLYHIGKVTR